MENNELQHHGIKGQKWGLRRYQNKDGTLTAAGKKRYDKEMAKLKEEEKKIKNKARTQAKIDKLLQKQQDIDEAKKRLDPEYRRLLDDKDKGLIKKATKPNKTKRLTNDELKAESNRLKLEKEYKELYEATRGKTGKKAKEVIENILSKSSENLLTQVVNHYGSKGLNKLIGEFEDVEITTKDKDGKEIKELKKQLKEVIYANNKKKS